MDALRSIPRVYLVFITVITLVLVLLGLGIVYKADSKTTFQLGNSAFIPEYVRSDTDKAKGLSGRTALNQRAAMVFVWDESSQHCFWMKDMQFSIDMIWLDADKRVVAIEKDVSPNSYPQQYCHEGQYVVELTAGTAKRLNLKTGDTAKF